MRETRRVTCGNHLVGICNVIAKRRGRLDTQLVISRLLNLYMQCL
jgi:hypothetical protein